MGTQDDDIQKIIANLSKAEDNYSELKDKTTTFVEMLGKKEEQLALQADGWSELLKTSITILPSVAASGVSLTGMVYSQSKDLLNAWDNSNLEQLVSISGTTSDASSSIVFVATSRLPNSPSHQKIGSYFDQENSRGDITAGLKKIDPNLADLYDNSWRNLYSESKDKGRSPLFLMRDVVRRIYQYYAPDNKVMGKYKMKDKVGINSLRINYMSDLLSGGEKMAFDKQSSELIRIYGSLSKAHMPGELNIEEAKGYFYQANSLIRLVLSSFKDV